MVGLGSLGRGGVGKRPGRHYGLRKGRQRVTGAISDGKNYFSPGFFNIWHFASNYFKSGPITVIPTGPVQYYSARYFATQYFTPSYFG